MYLFCDTETTKKYDFKKDYKDPSQPHIMQLAGIMCDEKREVIATLDVLIHPDGLYTEVSPEAEKIHGISFEQVEKYGVDPKYALKTLINMAMNCEKFIAHGLDHDLFMIKRHGEMVGVHGWESRMEKKVYCTMKNFAKKYRVPGAKWNKWPSLQEMHEFLFAKKFEGAHGALEDSIAVMNSYFELLNREELIGYETSC